jgi:uncharacterized protein
MPGQARRLTTLMIGAILGTQAMPVASADCCETARGRTRPPFQLCNEGSFAEAVALMRQHAEDGDALAQLYLATLYRTGTGLASDEYEAARWYAKAARQGIAEAQFHLGLMYLQGIGLTEDSSQALEWISRAADQGFDEAVDIFEYLLTNAEALAC